MSIGDRIRALRLELNMTQDELAQKLGYKSRSTINKIELGINDLTQSKIMEFAKALHTSPAYLMGWTDKKETKDIDAVYILKEDLKFFEKTMLNSECYELLRQYNLLNDDGKNKVKEYISDLVALGKYGKDETCCTTDPPKKSIG